MAGIDVLVGSFASERIEVREPASPRMGAEPR